MLTDDGLLILFQGWGCTDVKYRNSRGFASSQSYVELPGATTLRVIEPDADFLERRGPADSGPKTQEKNKASKVPETLNHEGTLVVMQVIDGRPYRVDVERLFITRLETVRLYSNLALWRVYLGDVRLFWKRGVMRDVRFNDKLPDGTEDRATLKKVGETFRPYTLAEIVSEKIVANLPGGRGKKLELAAYPAEWKDERTRRVFKPLELSVAALGSIVQEQGLEEPCLRLDGTVALHAAGDGKIGYTLGSVDGKSRGPNLAPLPDYVKLDEDAAGEGRVDELTYVNRFLAIVGGPRIATVAIDDAVPVVVIKGRVRLLNEATVRDLTLNKFGLEWLKKWILAAPAEQHATGIPQKSLAILREQAWRKWQVAGVSEFDAEGKYVKPGPNAHLLPLLPRAELDDGARRPVTVETSRFITIQKVHNKSDEEIEREAAMAEEQLARDAIKTVAEAQGKPDPWNLANPSDFLGLTPVPLFATTALKGTDTSSKVNDYRRDAMNVLVAKGLSPDLATKLDQAIEKKLSAQDKLNGTRTADLYNFAKKLVDLEKRAAKTPPAQLAAESEALLAQLKAIDERRERAGQTTSKQDQLGVQRGRFGLAVAFKNVGRFTEQPKQPDPTHDTDDVDTGARLYSDKLGIVETSGLAGHLDNPNVHAAVETKFVPKPVRVIFGSKLRPRATAPARQATGGGSASNLSEVGGMNVFQPEVLGDHESVLTVVFQRTGRGQAEEVPIDKVPPEVLATERRPDLVELIPLEGAERHRKALVEETREIAKAHFRKAERLTSTTHVLGYPWPINPDGIVSDVEIVCESVFVDGTPVPCIVKTVVKTGSSVFRAPRGGTQQRVRPIAGRPVAEL